MGGFFSKPNNFFALKKTKQNNQKTKQNKQTNKNKYTKQTNNSSRKNIGLDIDQLLLYDIVVSV